MNARQALVALLGLFLTRQRQGPSHPGAALRARRGRTWRIACRNLSLLDLLEPRLLMSATAAPQTLADLPAAAQQSISSAIGHDQSAYYATTAATGVTLANPANAFSATVQAGTLQVSAGADSWNMTLLAAGYGATAAGLPLGTAQTTASANRVDSNYGPIDAWYINGPAGLEQGFNVAPSTDGSAALTVTLDLGGNLTGAVNAAGDGLTLTRPDGSTALSYSGLTAYDAAGKALPATLEVQADGNHQDLLIHVNTAGAQGRITIDPYVQQAKLTASDGAASDWFGASVAISGSTVVVGAYAANSSHGAAYVFTESGTGWANMTQTAKLTASDGAASDDFGWSVAIDGSTVVVGANNAQVGGNSSQGAAYVFTESGTGWANMTQTAKLTASDGVTGDIFGNAVAISGSTVVVAASYAKVGSNPSQGAAYVFTKPGSGWANMTQTAKLTASDGALNDEFGNAIAVSGSTVVVGAFYAAIGSNPSQGAAYVFTKPGSGWANMTQTAKLTASDGAAGDYFGCAVAISGSTVVAGAYHAAVGGNSQGATYVFTEPGSGWANMTQTAKLTASDGAAYDYFGHTVGISGGTVVVGAAFATVGSNASQGTAYVYSSVVAPTVTTPTVTSITATTATLGGNATSDGAASITTRGVVYALTSVNSNPQIGGTGVSEVDDAAQTTGIFTESATGLSAAAGYSFVAFATNSVGTTYTSPVSTFTTLAATAPTVTTPTDTSLTAATATLGGDVTGDGGSALTTRGVLFALTSVNSNPTLGGTGVTEVDDAAATTGIFTESATGLTAATGYSFVAFATNSVGTTYTSPVSTFKTSAVAPTITTPTDTSLTAATATLGGDVTSDGGASLTKRGVVYTLTSVNSNPQIGGTGVIELDDAAQTTGIFTESATGLAAATGYSFVAFASNSVGTTYTSPVSTFTTSAVAPTVTTPTETSLTAATATLGGDVTSDGGASLTKRGVVYALTSVNSNPQVGGNGVTEVDDAAQTTGVFTESATGLVPVTGYSYVAFATNSVGTTYTSPVSTFTTPSAVAATTTAVTSSQPVATYGTALTFTATVTAATGSAAPAQGSVDFTDSTTGHDFGNGIFGASNGASSTWTLAITASAANALNVTTGDVITAAYTAGTGFTGSSGTVTQTITALPLTVTTASASKVYGQADPALTYSLTSGTLLGADALTGALARTVGQTVGSYPIGLGTLSAGGNYAITCVPGNLVITQSSSATAVVTTASGITPGAAVTFTATVSLPGSGVASGTVTFYDDGTPIGAPVTLNSAAQAALTTTTLATNSHQITASYSGDGNLLGSTSTVFFQMVGTPHQRYVEQLYHDLLRRTVDPLGLTDWVALLDSGTSYQAVAQRIATSAEYDGIVVNDFYQQYLGRPADPGSLRTWVGLMQGGMTPETVAADLVGSAEYGTHSGGTTSSFLASAYQNLLGHPIDPGSAASWTTYMNAGHSATAVAQLIINSDEGMGHSVTWIYNTFLHRNPEAVGLSGWKSFIAANATPANGPCYTPVLIITVSTPEYLAINGIV